MSGKNKTEYLRVEVSFSEILHYRFSKHSILFIILFTIRKATIDCSYIHFMFLITYT